MFKALITAIICGGWLGPISMPEGAIQALESCSKHAVKSICDHTGEDRPVHGGRMGWQEGGMGQVVGREQGGPAWGGEWRQDPALGLNPNPCPQPSVFWSGPWSCTSDFAGATLHSSIRAAAHYLRQGECFPLALGCPAANPNPGLDMV